MPVVCQKYHTIVSTMRVNWQDYEGEWEKERGWMRKRENEGEKDREWMSKSEKVKINITRERERKRMK